MSQVKSIKCTNCAAPLDLLGGGRVESITCSYCKSVLDLNDNYKVLTNFKMVKERHKLPFDVGMKGKIKKIDYTIIGRVTYADIEYPHGEWTDFLLFSPLYGYAYLTYEEGHLIYSKRSRTFPNLTWLETLENSELYVDEKAYVPFDEYEGRVVYVEGELTWVAKRGDKTSFIDLIAPPYGLSVEKTKNEIEHYQAQYLDASTTYEAFGIEEEKEPTTFYPLKPFERPFLKSLSRIAFIFIFIAALLLMAIQVDGLGKIISNISADNKVVKDVNFTVNSSKYLVALELQSPKSKELNNFNVQIRKNNKLLLSVTPSATYIFKETNGEVEKKLHSWEKHATKVLILLNLEALGEYQLSIKPIDMTFNSTLHIKIKEAYSELNYATWFFVLTLALWLFYKVIQWLHKLKVNNARGIYLNEDTEYNLNFYSKNNFTGSILHIILIVVFISISIIFDD